MTLMNRYPWRASVRDFHYGRDATSSCTLPSFIRGRIGDDIPLSYSTSAWEMSTIGVLFQLTVQGCAAK